MGLNPVQFGKDVIEQYGRYLKGSFPLIDDGLRAQFGDKLKVGEENLISKGPYVYLNKPFIEGARLSELEIELGLHRNLKDIFPFDSIHSHQEKALRAINSGKNLIVSTGTGSGKTESFLLPIVDACLKANESKTESGVMAIIIYPMNALVNDQLERLRDMLAGSGVSFGRYTGETNQTELNREKIEYSRKYSSEELQKYQKSGERPLPYEECYTREEILKNKPRILLTNYSQLEYLLLRDKDLEIFRSPTLKFLIFDEVHTYTGALGSEVACLTRRVKSLFPTKVQCIGTSATVANEDSSSIIKTFASRLFGEEESSIVVVEEEYKERDIKEYYNSNLPQDALKLLDEILEEARGFHLQEDVDEISQKLLDLTVELTGITPKIDGSNIEKAGWILAHSEYIRAIEDEFNKPKLPKEAFKRLKTIGNRKNASDRVLEAELLAYLTLGILVKYENEPVIRPKLHYFIKGLNSANVSYENADSPKLHFSQKSDGKYIKFGLKVCRTCGQHYHQCIYEKNAVSENGVGVYSFIENARDYQKIDSDNHSLWLLADKLYTFEEAGDDEMEALYLCRNCGGLHKKDSQTCQNPKCRSNERLIKVNAIELKGGEASKCYACGATKRATYLPITDIKTTEVLDVMILSQTMLSTMQENELKKLLIFADGRQDAAFQASWMSERSKRFHLRFQAKKVLDSFDGELDKALSYDGFVSRLVLKAEENYIYPGGSFKKDELNKRIRWFLIDEIASARQRNSIENLGMCKVVYDGIESNDFFEEWALKLGTSAEKLCELCCVILDSFRKKGAISDDLAKRRWNDKDLEVREGLVSLYDNYSPHAFVFEKNSETKNHQYNHGYIHTFKTNGRGAIEQILKKNFEDKSAREEFIGAFWDYCLNENLFVNVELIEKGYGGDIRKIFDRQTIYQINKDRLGFKKSDKFYRCNVCKKISHNKTPTMSCPTYNCKGMLEPKSVDEDNYDVYQYTKLNYMPIKPEEHSAQVNKEKRDEIEKQFKKLNGNCNCLVATPTLEMGVDIGKLEMVLLKNVPPSTPNYTQRVGRAGRRHRIATVFTYCRNMSHDSYFFEVPEEMITGNIRIPAFSMSNARLIKKHIHSSVLTWLRNNTSADEILKASFPTYIRDYVVNIDDYGKASFKDSADDFEGLREAIKQNIDGLYSFVKKVFFDSWTIAEKEEITEEFLKRSIYEMVDDLRHHLSELILEIKTYRSIIAPYKQKEVLSDSERREFNSYDKALNSYTKESQDNYTLSFLAKDGFFPSYALGRESVRAVCVEPLFEISRPSSVAIRELTPANKVYANKNIYEPVKLNFSKLKEKDTNFHSEDIRKDMIVNQQNGAILENINRLVDGGDKEYAPFISYEMVDISLSKLQKIDDNRESRVRVGFKSGARVLENHFGGTKYKLGGIFVEYLKNGKVRLINMGTYGQKRENIGFLVCPSCGAFRNPMASDREHADFIENHMQRCHIKDSKLFWSALHTDIESDMVIFDSFDDKSTAANFLEAIKSGSIEVLDMRDGDIDGVVEPLDNDKFRVVFYDSLPGGSGFLPLLVSYYQEIVDKAQKKLSKCDCEDVCYKCLLSYSNQQFHPVLNRQGAIGVLRKFKQSMEKMFDIPINLKQVRSQKETDSPAEDKFLKKLGENSFPEPVKQYKVELGNGQSTIADFAYPDAKLLLYIDGLSNRIHGNALQAEKDKMLREKAKMKGFEVIAISAAALNDDELISGYLEIIGMKLHQLV